MFRNEIVNIGRPRKLIGVRHPEQNKCIACLCGGWSNGRFISHFRETKFIRFVCALFLDKGWTIDKSVDTSSSSSFSHPLPLRPSAMIQWKLWRMGMVSVCLEEQQIMNLSALVLCAMHYKWHHKTTTTTNIYQCQHYSNFFSFLFFAWFRVLRLLLSESSHFYSFISSSSSSRSTGATVIQRKSQLYEKGQECSSKGEGGGGVIEVGGRHSDKL